MVRLIHVYSGTQTADGTKFARSATRIDFSEEVLPGDYTVEVKTPATQATYQLDMSGLINDPNFDGGTVSINGVGIDYEKGMSADDVYKQLMSVADEIGCKIEKDPNNAGVYNITADNRGSKETLTIGMSEEMAQKTGLSNAQGVVQNADDKSYKLVASGTDAEIELKDGFGSTVITNVEGNRVKITDKGGFSMDFLLSDDIQATGATLVFDVTDVGAMTIQIGANQYQNMDVHIPEVSSESLYLDTVNVAVNGGADKAISTMDAAIAKLSAIRSGIGAYTNRLEYASSSLAETQEDMTTAYSGLMDTDMASEMTEYTQQNILEQKQKDLTAFLEQRKLLEMQIGKTQTELTTITDQINQNQQQTAAEKSRYEQLQKQRENMEKELGERTKEEILSQIQIKTEEQKKLEIHYKTVTEAREVLEKRMTELDSVIASLTEQLKESISISAEELNAQKENFAQQKKSLSENRDEIHARLEINSDMYEKIRRQQTELLKTETRWKWMKSLSDTANGTITGKARIMLETYIQMQYFDRILARANIRLMTMSSGQYELVRRKENKSRVGKTGLELDVVDHYNGTVRSVKTLSGGETFQASLSLALGLSDEIQSSSGGIQLDTMFVDEGFGSLDEDALDQAIRALKDLSQGSRLVGIVSHVAELKERIDKKIIVTKKRTEDGVGSTICIEG